LGCKNVLFHFTKLISDMTNRQLLYIPEFSKSMSGCDNIIIGKPEIFTELINYMYDNFAHIHEMILQTKNKTKLKMCEYIFQMTCDELNIAFDEFNLMI